MRRPLILGLLLLAAPPACRGGESGVVQPPAGTFKMRKELVGEHPRLYFTREQIPEIRRRAQGAGKWFLDRAKANFAGRLVGKPVKKKMAPWERYLYGFWGLFTMDMLYVVEGRREYVETAKALVRWLLSQENWGGDDLIPMEMLSGLAVTYDILYDEFSEAERAAIRARIFKEVKFIHGCFFVGQYWTRDYQNNHMHNRIHGLANACFAIYGDDPKTDVGKYADLALAQFARVVEWLPADGSTHEGPGYWSYGHHWVVRTAHLVEHVTGKDVAGANPHFKNSHYYRLYMTAPGWKTTFNIGDSGPGAPSNLTALCRLIAEAGDPHGTAFLREMMRTNPGGFYQHPAWGLLWYDASIKPRPLEELPLYRFWPDLEMFSIRSSWKADATALVFKCGPVGGHRLQRLRKGKWANVAHDHPDQNHFLLFAAGKMLAEDDGYPKKKKLTRSHNTVVIDGKGQPREGTGWQQPFAYGKSGLLRDVFLSGAAAYAAGDGSRLYDGAERFVRHLAFVEGDYVAVLDDLVGSGGAEHTFEWRLHKDGPWKKLGPGRFSVADGDASLEVRFLAPAPAEMKSAFLPAELTAKPCLAVRRRARRTRFLALLVPRKKGKPAIAAEPLEGRGCVALRAAWAGREDFFAAAGGPGGLTFGPVRAAGSAALLRRSDGRTESCLLVRGTSLSVDGRALLGASRPANLAWRRSGRGFRVEVEAPYKEAGGRTAITIGGLAPGAGYPLAVDGKQLRAVTADRGGTAQVTVDLAKRRTVQLGD